MRIRCEAGNCAIVISMKTAFKRFPKSFSLLVLFCQKSHSTKGYNPWLFMHDLGSKLNLQQNGHRLNVPFMLIKRVHIFTKKDTQPKAYNPRFFMIMGQNLTYRKTDIFAQWCKSHLCISSQPTIPSIVHSLFAISMHPVSNHGHSVSWHVNKI